MRSPSYLASKVLAWIRRAALPHTGRKSDADELRRRDLILEALTRISVALLSTTAIDATIPGLLEIVADAVEADRVFLLENQPGPDNRIVIREGFAWNRPGIEPVVYSGHLRDTPETRDLLNEFFHKLPHGKVFASPPQALPARIGTFFKALSVRSLLVVPIPGQAGLWGYLGIDDCHVEREWAAPVCDALLTLAEIIGASIQRADRIAALADARLIVENSTTVLFRLKAEASLPLTYISANVSGWGYQPSRFTDSPTFYKSLIHPDDQVRVHEWSTHLLAEDVKSASVELRFRISDGSYRWFDDRFSIVRDASGQVQGIEGILIDITERKKSEEQLIFSNTLLKAAVENSPDGVLAVAADGKVLSFNEHLLEMWKIPAQLAAGGFDEPILKAVLASVRNPGAFAENVRYVYEHPKQIVHDEIELLDNRVFERHSSPLYDSTDRYLGRIWFFRDITGRRQSELEMAKLARTDALTGLANRATFLERLDLAFAASKRGAVPFALLFVDLDRFKEINDTLGHHAGDVVLKETARRMVARIRSTDLAARLGGDEFIILQADAVDVSAAAALAAEIRAALAEPYTLDGNQARMTASVGVAAWSPEVSNPAEILARADRALYLAKEEGGDRFRFHSGELDRIVHERMRLSDELRSAIARNELELCYLPQIAVATGAVVGVEALVWWNHPSRGRLKPEEFLPVAERTGAMVPLVEWVLDRACRQFGQWRQEGVAPQVIAVNLHGTQLKLRAGFAGDVATVLKKWGLAPGDLEFHVPEALLMASAASDPDILGQLRDLGVGIAIDDFGGDYTSVGRARVYGVRRCRISPEFVAKMASKPGGAGVVRLMASLAGQLGIELIARSVGEVTQAGFLESVAQPAMPQDGLFSEPLSRVDMTELLRRTRAPAASLLRKLVPTGGG